MPIKLDLGIILDFLEGLKENNNKPWFEQHRQDYQSARDTYERFINIIIDEFRVSDHLQGLSARDCIPRIYRDIRFSKDKSPYKTNLGAHVAPGGWKSASIGYYISIEPHGQSLLASGLYNPTTAQLERFRHAIDRDAGGFKKITQAKEFVALFGPVSGIRLKTVPKGYDREHPEISLLQLKQVMAMQRYEDRLVRSDDFSAQVVNACRAVRPFVEYLNDILG